MAWHAKYKLYKIALNNEDFWICREKRVKGNLTIKKIIIRLQFIVYISIFVSKIIFKHSGRGRTGMAICSWLIFKEGYSAKNVW